MAAMPDIHFDIVTTAFSKEAAGAPCPVPNAHVHRVGRGRPSDKYLLPLLGLRKAWQLHRKHRYIFAWALMASYAGLAGIFLKRVTQVPLLITLADQNLSRLSWVKRKLLTWVLTDADQVYGEAAQEKDASRLSSRAVLSHSIGGGDAFANAIRFAYSGRVHRRLEKSV